MSNWLNGFRMLEGETVKSLLIGTRPWRVRPTSGSRRFPTWTPATTVGARFEPGARWSARRAG
jgi:hypothetical protein